MRWVLAAVLALAGTLATAFTALGWNWPWLTIAAASVAAVLALPNNLVVKRLERRDQRKDDHQRELSLQSVGGGRGTIRDISNPTVLGVHRAPGGDTPPPYIRRDKHQSLVDSPRPGAFAVVIGDSGAGKSRLAYEAELESAASEVDDRIEEALSHSHEYGLAEYLAAPVHPRTQPPGVHRGRLALGNSALA